MLAEKDGEGVSSLSSFFFFFLPPKGITPATTEEGDIDFPPGRAHFLPKGRDFLKGPPSPYSPRLSLTYDGQVDL